MKNEISLLHLNNDSVVAVIGMGQTGLSCIRYLLSQGIKVKALDTRSNPPNLEILKSEFPGLEFHLGEIITKHLEGVTHLVVSPGLDIRNYIVNSVFPKDIRIIGDLDLFAVKNKIPYIAVTGSNGKTTVVNLLYKMANIVGENSYLAGNVGIAALDSLQQAIEPSLFILECSSFQLDINKNLEPLVACILNITPDHLDRYKDFPDYIASKHQIFKQAKYKVYNRDDKNIKIKPSANIISFGLSKPILDNDWGVICKNKEQYIVQGNTEIIPVANLPIKTNSMLLNYLAALAIGSCLNWDLVKMLEGILTFNSLPHRLEKVKEYNNISFWNDSKATNIGAAISALLSIANLKQSGRVFWLAGGDGKNADFSELIPYVNSIVDYALLFGKDKNQLAAICEGSCNWQIFTTMQEAVEFASLNVIPNDIVLLSPACASTDQFKNYEHRGDSFKEIVTILK